MKNKQPQLPKENYKYCKYNSNRHAYKIVNPYCTWEYGKAIPPHLHFSQNTKLTQTICSKCKCFEMIEIGKKYQCQIIVCSSDATDHYEIYLDKGANFIIRGEGEITLLELIKQLEKKEDVTTISGIVFKNNNEILLTPERTVLQNLDELPIPAWDLVDSSVHNSVYNSVEDSVKPTIEDELIDDPFN
jgi:hypothetical protein